ncbi:MAG TPA: serine hydrolase domain-containing protein, partial [Verrucomicrobiae bacterium]|nr:serine hydrolase domain-containing protein [Verrucomicrobiae bacterium]
MRRKFAAALMGLLGLISATLAHAQEAFDPGLEAYVDGIVHATMEEHRIVGLTLSIVDDDRIVMTRGYGYADWETRRAVDAERDLFRIGSITKTFTFTALMQLVEAGRVDIDADVNTYLDGFRIPDAFGAPITIRDLLTHRPGFEESVRNVLTRPEDLAPLREWIAGNIPGRALPPGAQISYSNYGAALAGYIVEKVSGEPYEQYIDAHIMRPLQMDSSSARQVVPGDGARVLSPALASRVVTGYTLEHNVFRALPFEVIAATPAGSISATAPDMARYMLAHLNDGAYLGGRILAPETARLMRERPYPGHPGPDWDYGFRSGMLAGYDTFEHGGATGAFFATATMIPELKLGVFVAVNGADSPIAQVYIANDILVRLIGARARAEPERVQLTEAQLAHFTGAYMSTRRSYTQFYKLLSLLGGTENVALTGDGGLRINAEGQVEDFYPIGPRSFRGRYRGDVV